MKLPLISAAALALCGAATATAQTKVWTDHNPNDKGFRFDKVPPPAGNDVASNATLTMVAGTPAPGSADVTALTDGKLPTGMDEPAQNFFFAGDDGGRLRLDLGKVTPLARVGTYSWHAEGRAPQVYKLYAATGTEAGFQPEPGAGTDPARAGWKLLATVDTTPKDGDLGGQYGAAIVGGGQSGLGRYRYLLFDVAKGVPKDPFGNTFYSEIDVEEIGGARLQAIATPEKVWKEIKTPDGKYTFLIDATLAPDLLPWAEKQLMPMIFQWYPKLVKMLPSKGFKERDNVLLEFRTDMGGTPAYAAGGRVALNVEFFRQQLSNEAMGAVVHELVHVVQDYWRSRRGQGERRPAQTPTWVSEGIADYIRWFIYEPQSKGAEITGRNFARSKYDDSYRVTANFLNWVIANHDKDIVVVLNTAAREGRYSEEIWKQRTGKTAAELGAEWKAANAKRLKIKSEGA